jgi:DnaJ-domain-containing protein 1
VARRGIFMNRWLEILVLIFILFVFYRRGSVRKAGEAVGRAKAKIPGSKQPAASVKIETVLNRDFNTLDLKPNASFDDVKHAYRELAKVWHPDRFGNDARLKDRANVKLGEINAAYERLKTHFGK